MRAIRGFVVVLVAVLVAASCSSDSSPPKSEKPSASAKPGKVEVKDAVFVLNPDKSATLSATVLNGTDGDYTINEPPKSTSGAGQSINMHFDAPTNVFPTTATSTIGNTSDNTEIRLVPAPAVGDNVSIVLDFRGATEERVPYVLTVKAPVVARTPAHDAVISSELNSKITIKDANIVVIRGQAKAYVDAIVVSSIEDSAWMLPTAVNAKGEPVEYRHQTATGGPYGIQALKDRGMLLGGPPYTTHEGDADYFDAKDVTIGESITVTIPFRSGDVKAVFTVVVG